MGRGPGAHAAHVRAGIWLRDADGCRPAAFHELADPFGAGLGRGKLLQYQRGGALRAGDHAHRHAGAVEQFAAGDVDERRQALAAELDRLVDRVPALFDQLIPRLFVAVGGEHLAVLQPAALRVAATVGRIEHFLGEAGRGLQDHAERFAPDQVGVGMPGEQLGVRRNRLYLTKDDFGLLDIACVVHIGSCLFYVCGDCAKPWGSFLSLGYGCSAAKRK
ncbi:hypothetical protein XAC3615_14540002 [Xanthomonas citri pv. citri]|nr:hypothetical protein XAC3615_14540002 [Xanthomonas citri pv. citri]